MRENTSLLALSHTSTDEGELQEQVEKLLDDYTPAPQRGVVFEQSPQPISDDERQGLMELVRLQPDVLQRLTTWQIQGVLEALGSSKQRRETGQLKTITLVDELVRRKKDAGRAKTYLKTLESRLRKFASIYPILPEEAEPARSFLRGYNTDGVSTRSDMWRSLKLLYDFANREHGAKNVIKDIERPHWKTKPGSHLKLDEAKRLVAAVKGDFEWALVVCYFGLRLRREEAARLRFSDIRGDSVTIDGKMRTEELPILPEFRERLLALKGRRKATSHIFWSERYGAITAKGLAYHIGKIFERADLHHDGIKPAPHTLRNTAASLYMMYGGDAISNGFLLRHKTGNITSHYSYLTTDQLLEKEQRHNPLLQIMRELGIIKSNGKAAPASVLDILPCDGERAPLHFNEI